MPEASIGPLKVVKFSIGTGTNTGLESFRMIYWAGFIGTTSSVMRNPSTLIAPTAEQSVEKSANDCSSI